MPFYYAYCEDEKKELHNADADKKVAENAKKHHEDKNPTHTVKILEK